MEDKQVAGRQLMPITALIKEHKVDASTRKFNELLMLKGFLEERTRPSSVDPTKTKKYKAITDAGLEYGENIGNDYTDETQPRYYADSFMDLVQELGLTTKS